MRTRCGTILVTAVALVVGGVAYAKSVAVIDGETLPGQGVRVQLEQVRDWALKSGLYVGGSTAEVGKALERVAPSLAVRDGIVVTDKRVGTKRGVEIRTLKGGSGL